MCIRDRYRLWYKVNLRQQLSLICVKFSGWIFNHCVTAWKCIFLPIKEAKYNNNETWRKPSSAAIDWYIRFCSISIITFKKCKKPPKTTLSSKMAASSRLTTRLDFILRHFLCICIISHIHLSETAIKAASFIYKRQRILKFFFACFLGQIWPPRRPYINNPMLPTCNITPVASLYNPKA